MNCVLKVKIESEEVFFAEHELMQWKEESKASFESYNKMMEERGLVSEEIRLL